MSQRSPQVEVSFKLPVNNFQLKLLEFDLGPSPWRLSTKIYEGELLLGLMILKTQKVAKNSQTFRVTKRAKNALKKVENFTTSGKKNESIYEVIIPQYYWENYSIKGFEPQSITSLILFVEDKWRNGLYNFVDSRRLIYDKGIKMKDTQILQSMKDFCKKYSITEEEMMFESLIKDYFRKRVAKNHNVVQIIRKKTMNMSEKTPKI